MTGSWSAANRILKGFINNDATYEGDNGETINEKVNLSKIVKPKTDN
jgi:hypothetical protein